MIQAHHHPITLNSSWFYLDHDEGHELTRSHVYVTNSISHNYTYPIMRHTIFGSDWLALALDPCRPADSGARKQLRRWWSNLLLYHSFLPSSIPCMNCSRHDHPKQLWLRSFGLKVSTPAPQHTPTVVYQCQIFKWYIEWSQIAQSSEIDISFSKSLVI